VTDQPGGDGILVIPGPGLGRFVQTLGALSALRRHHAGQRIVVLTSAEAAAFAGATPFVDSVIIDEELPWWDLRATLALRKTLRQMHTACVYDFGDPVRSKWLFRLKHGWRVPADKLAAIAWSGRVPGTALYDPHAQRAGMHIVDRVIAQLGDAGIAEVPLPDLSWVARTVKSYTAPFKMNEPYVLIGLDGGPGGAWTTAAVIAAAAWAASQGLTPVLVGLSPQPLIAEEVQDAVPRTRDISGQAPGSDLVFLAWGARAAVGPDSGLMTLIATAGCKSAVLCGTGSDPTVEGPRGPHVAVVRRDNLADIKFAEIARLLEPPPNLAKSRNPAA